MNYDRQPEGPRQGRPQDADKNDESQFPRPTSRPNSQSANSDCNTGSQLPIQSLTSKLHSAPNDPRYNTGSRIPAVPPQPNYSQLDPRYNTGSRIPAVPPQPNHSQLDPRYNTGSHIPPVPPQPNYSQPDPRYNTGSRIPSVPARTSSEDNGLQTPIPSLTSKLSSPHPGYGSQNGFSRPDPTAQSKPSVSRPDPGFESGVHRTTKPFRTGEDADLLREIVQQSRKQPLDVQRMTTQEIRALKVTSEFETLAGVSIRRQVQRFFSGLLSGLTGLFSRHNNEHKNQCAIYGHVVLEGWTGPYPKCDKCGAQVTSADQLRGTAPKKSS